LKACNLTDANFEAVARGEQFDHPQLLFPQRTFRRANAGQFVIVDDAKIREF
jgi:hypothetical protein